MGIVRITFLEEINNKLNKHQCYNQWCITFTVIECFRAIENKKPCKFIKFHYPLISEELLKTFFDFARNIIEIEDKIIDVIKHARKSLLFHDGNTRVKKQRNSLFDVTMEIWNEAVTICELLGL